MPAAVADGEEGRGAADLAADAVVLGALALVLARRGTLLPHAAHRVHQQRCRQTQVRIKKRGNENRVPNFPRSVGMVGTRMQLSANDDLMSD